MASTALSCDVAIVGGGTSGLALATELMRLSVGKVVVLEREGQAGGVPRYCNHYPFGIRKYKRLLTGPAYARRNNEIAAELGAEIRTNSNVIRLLPDGALEVSTHDKRYILQAKRVVLCMGVRESSRAQRFISGDRPPKVLSTGALQRLLYHKGIKPFKRPIILGSELVSFSAVQTCAHFGIRPVAMVEEEKRLLARQIFRPYLSFKGVPLHTGVTDIRIIGKYSVEAFAFIDRRGQEQRINTDGIIVSGRFRPESALLRASHIKVDPRTGGPVIDQFGRSTDPAYFCTGNLLRPAETSDFCWQEGIATAQRVAADLKQGVDKNRTTIPVVIDHPAVRFVVPQHLRVAQERGGIKTFYLGLTDEVQATIIVHCKNKVHWKGRLRSRPVRRILIPLPEINASDPPDEIRISVIAR